MTIIRVHCSLCKVECIDFKYECPCEECLIKTICSSVCKEAIEYWGLYWKIVAPNNT